LNVFDTLGLKPMGLGVGEKVDDFCLRCFRHSVQTIGYRAL
jgi:hypothetical protein